MKKICFFWGGPWGSKWCNVYTAASENNLFLGRVKIVPYIYTFFIKPAAGGKKLGGGSRFKIVQYIHIFYTAHRRRKTFVLFKVKMVPYIYHASAIVDSVFVYKNLQFLIVKFK